MTLKEFIAANEFAWWHERLSQAKVRKAILEATGVKIGREKGMFKEFCAVNMSIYANRAWRRKPVSKNKDLTEGQWDKLRMVVEQVKGAIAGEGITVAFDIIRTRISTNIFQLNGLPKRLHYWE